MLLYLALEVIIETENGDLSDKSRAFARIKPWMKMVYRSYRGLNLTPIWVLIGLNLLLFIATLIVPRLILFLGLMPAGILTRPWTIITNLFLHGSIGHILANMITLYFFGRYLCALVGEKKFLAVYFIGGILGNIFYII